MIRQNKLFTKSPSDTLLHHTFTYLMVMHMT